MVLGIRYSSAVMPFVHLHQADLSFDAFATEALDDVVHVPLFMRHLRLALALRSAKSQGHRKAQATLANRSALSTSSFAWTYRLTAEHDVVNCRWHPGVQS